MFELNLSIQKKYLYQSFYDFINNYMPENFPEVKYTSKEIDWNVGPGYKIRSDKLYNIFDLGFFWGIYRASYKSETNNRVVKKKLMLRLLKKIK